MARPNTGRPRDLFPCHPIEIKKFIWEEKERGGGRVRNINLLRNQIKEKYNVDLTYRQVEQVGAKLFNESDVHRTKTGKCNPNWTPEEANYAAKLYLALPSRANTEVWNTLLSSVNDTFHKGAPIRSTCSVRTKMDKLGIKRTNTTNNTAFVHGATQTFEYYEKILLEAGLKLLPNGWTSGIARWKIQCLTCNEVYVKNAIFSYDMAKSTGVNRVTGCKYCKDNPNAYAELYLTKVFCEKSGVHSKLGISKDPSNRIPSFGTTLTDTTWPNLTNSMGRKIEDQVAEKFGMYKTYPEELIGNGHTECYNTLVHEQIKEYVYQLLLDAKSRIPQNIS